MIVHIVGAWTTEYYSAHCRVLLLIILSIIECCPTDGHVLREHILLEDMSCKRTFL